MKINEKRFCLIHSFSKCDLRAHCGPWMWQEMSQLYFNYQQLSSVLSLSIGNIQFTASTAPPSVRLGMKTYRERALAQQVVEPRKCCRTFCHLCSVLLATVGNFGEKVSTSMWKWDNKMLETKRRFQEKLIDSLSDVSDTETYLPAVHYSRNVELNFFYEPNHKSDNKFKSFPCGHRLMWCPLKWQSSKTLGCAGLH